MMKRTTDTRSLILATDLDGTFAGGTASDRARLQAALRVPSTATLIYVTGRSVPATRELMAELDLPHPDVLIADVGTTVLHGEALVPVEEIERQIERAWPGADAVRERLRGTPNIREQDVHAPRRVSYWLEGAPMRQVLDDLARRLEGVQVDLVGSADTYIDVLPGGVNKGSTLRRVLRWLDREEADVVVAGDTMNDLALFETGIRGVVVGNCEPALRELVGGREHLYCASGHGAAGILEGLQHFGWIEEGSHGQ